MIPEGELRLISSWTTLTTHDRPYYTVLLYCMIINSDVYSSVLAGAGEHSSKNDYFGKESIMKCI